MLALGWLYMTVEFIRAAFIGRFPFWRRKADGRTWPPVRSESPVRFWFVWTFAAGPFLFITALALLGLFGSAFGLWTKE